VSQALLLAGSVAAVAGLAAVALMRLRMASVAEAAARACHELRGPLAAARLGLELSSRGGSTDDPRLRAIELELARATLALEDLDRLWDGSRLCRVEAQQSEPVDVARLLADSVEAWQGQASVRGVRLQLLESRVRPIVRGDRLRLAQATGNLIANAIEHGGGIVEVSWHADAEVVRIEVSDHGPGLPAPVAELALRPSRPWGRVGPTGSRRARRRAGSRRGHGLAIASAIAASHRGHLASAPSEHGARLVLELRHAAQTSHPQIAG
jgi:signal transduction histidine kinase